ncbi:hypothetical protein P0Y35_08335 [Kiritimatiellaeota bacterium B1221]|nr:hypothetical protein [Kiritimatiellaeota bacterium B1221]
MKPFFFGCIFATLCFILLFIWLHQVGKSPRHHATGVTEAYKEALSTSASLAENPEVGGAQEREWIANVEKAFHPFTPEGAAKYFPLAYAETLYFRDAFHHYTDLETMVAYMVKSAEMSPGVTFEFSPVVRSGIDFYLPWVMVLPSKNGGEAQRSVGVSHLRFNAQGKVIFHQDYWDSADVLVPKVPVANGLIELVRRRF